MQQTKGNQNLEGTRASLREQLDVSQHTLQVWDDIKHVFIES